MQEKLHEKQHISQQRFDLELKIYISLSEKLNNAIDDCVSLIMTGQYKYFKCRHFDSNMKSFAKANIDVIYKNNTELSTWQTRIIGLIGKGLDELSV